MSKELIERLRALSRAEHDDLSVGEEAADKVEELERERDQLLKDVKMLRDCIQLLYSWANNWDSEFMNDPDWKNRDVLIIQEALASTDPK